MPASACTALAQKDELLQLFKLKEQGVLTEAEFVAAKAELLPAVPRSRLRYAIAALLVFSTVVVVPWFLQRSSTGFGPGVIASDTGIESQAYAAGLGENLAAELAGAKKQTRDARKQRTIPAIVVDEHHQVLPYWFQLGSEAEPLGATLVLCGRGTECRD